MELFVDNFAGGGGASTGIEMAIGRSVDIAINHDPDAIAMHRANHPNTRHYCENVWEVDPKTACNGNDVALAWFSPDCKHFSRAKGGKPVDKNIRGLAWVAIRWAYEVRPKVIMLENVPELMTWGPLITKKKKVVRKEYLFDEKTHKPILGGDGYQKYREVEEWQTVTYPDPERAGETFNAFIGCLTTGIDTKHPAFMEMCNALSISPWSVEAETIASGLGYKVEFKVLKSCDYGAPTTRTRLYMIARCDGKPIIWPKATHADKKSEAVKVGRCKPYRTAAECIDWTNVGKSIFERDKPLCDNTLKRIEKGFEKFILNSENPYVVEDKYLPYFIQYHSEQSEKEVRGQRVDDPIMTLDTSNRYALVMPYIMTLRNNMIGQDVREPITTFSTHDHHEVVYAYFIKYYSGVKTNAIDKPIDTFTTKDRFALVTVLKEQYVIADIFMRFLTEREMYDMTGFPGTYKIDADADGKSFTRQTKVEKVGNAVTPPVPAALVRANLPEYCKGA